MSRQRSVRIAKSLFVLAIAVVGFIAAETLTSGVVPTAQATSVTCVCPPGLVCVFGPDGSHFCADPH